MKLELAAAIGGSAGRRNLLSGLGETPHIAILRAGGVGDLLATTPALTTLKITAPGAHITLITSAALYDLARRYPQIDRVVVAPVLPGRAGSVDEEAALRQFFSCMQQEAFDLAIQWHGGGRHSNDFVSRLGARLTAGFRTVDAPLLDYWIPYDPSQHEVLRYLDLLRLLGVEPTSIEMHLPVLPSDYDELAGIHDLLDPDALKAGRYIGIHPTAGARNRKWPPERFARVAERLLDEFDIKGVLVTAGTGQEADSAAVVGRFSSRDRVVDLGGKTTLGALVAIISQLRLFLGNDNGPSHIAEALGTPSVIAFGAANPLNWAPLHRTWHRAVAHVGTPCRWMIDDRCAETSTASCVLGANEDLVLAEARQLLMLVEGAEARLIVAEDKLTSPTAGGTDGGSER